MAPASQDALAVETSMGGYDFGKYVNVMETAIIVEANNAAIMMSTKLRDRVVQNILDGSLPLEPLNAKYKLYKAKHGLDTRTLIATMQYLDSIDVWKWKRGDLLTVRVGVRPQAIHKTETPGGHQGDVKGGKTRKVRMVDLARWLEYGTSRMPPRPAWFLTWRKLLDESKTFQDWYERQVRKHIRRELRKTKLRERAMK